MEKGRVDDLLDLLNTKFYKKTQLPPMAPISSNTLQPSLKPQTPSTTSVFVQPVPVSKKRQAFDEEIELDEVGEVEQRTMKNFYPKSLSTNSRQENEYLEDSDYVPSPESRDQLSRKDKVPTRDKGFTIRRVGGEKQKNIGIHTVQGMINLVPEITPDINVKVNYKPRLTENRLANSKHVLFQTFNRYMNNPTAFQQRPAIQDLVDLNANFVDPKFVKQLFKTGATDREQEQKYLVFRPFYGDVDAPMENPEYDGFSYKMPNGNIKIIKCILKDNGFVETATKQNWNIWWHIGKIKSEQYVTLKHFQKVNHHPHTIECTKKDKMNQNLSAMVSKFGKAFDFVPKTYLLPQEISLLLRDSDQKKHQRRYYIVKPNAASQGKGIYVTNDVQGIISKNVNGMLVSEYVQNPLLINGIKFDLRIYVLITSFNPLRIYIYDEGLVRFATEQFTLHPSQMANRFVHLTNYSINKFSDKYVDYTEEGIGTKWTLSALKKTMRNMGLDPELMMMRIEDIIIKTVISIEHRVYKSSEQCVPFRNNCFDFLGFDVLIDSELTPWLLEVNLSPSLACETDIDFKIKSQLVAEIFNLVGIVADPDKKPEMHTVNMNLFKYTSADEANKYQIGKEERKKELKIIQETREEVGRCENFKLIFPSYNFALYKQYFEEERPLNKALFEEITKNLGKIKHHIQ